MSEGGYKIRDQYAKHYFTFTVIDWIDVFTRKRYKDIILDSLEHCQKEKQLAIHSYMIVNNYMHCILSSKNGKLSNTIKEFKTHTSKKIIEALYTKNLKADVNGCLLCLNIKV